jgi:cytoskeletal protein RodZ
MGQEVRGVPEAAAVESVGRYLARQRTLRGISLDDLAVLTRIPRRSLERLEAGAFDRHPDGFARGFVRTVAGALGLDPDEAVLRLMNEPPDDDPTRGVAREWARRGIVVGLALGLAIAVVAALAWSWRSPIAAPSAEPAASEIVYRRDAVRGLAARPSGERAPGAAMRPADEPSPEDAAKGR